jgi:putative DNA primase/helicase
MRLKHYGHLGPAFIHKLIEDKRDFLALLDLVMQKFSTTTTTNLEKRASSVFAIIGLAGELVDSPVKHTVLN